MDEKVTLENLRIAKIKDFHNLNTFTSYEKELVGFLLEDALDNQKKNLSVTFLWFYQEQLAAYITLLTDKINLEGDLRESFQNKGIYYRSLPALKVGRLCVNDRFLKRGIGKLMMGFAADKAKEINEDKAGCRFMTVDAKEGSVGFYEKLGFEPMQAKKDSTTAMCLDLLKPQH